MKRVLHWMPPFRPGKGFLFPGKREVRPSLLWKSVLFLCLAILAGPGPTLASSGPQRIISMSPSITETLFALGVGDRVVGVTDFCIWPEEACTRTRVGGLLNPNLEVWISLRPDLVILQDTSERLLKHARNLGIPTLVVDMSRLESIYNSFRVICERLDCKSAAGTLTENIRQAVESYREKLKDVPTKQVLLLLGDSADPARDMYAVGPATFLGELITLAGGRNLLTDPVAQYPRISKEFVLSASPEVIIEAGPKSNLNPEQRRIRLEQWAKFSSVTAVKTDQIYFIGSDFILIPGPRLVETLGQFARAIHPQVFSKEAP